MEKSLKVIELKSKPSLYRSALSVITSCSLFEYVDPRELVNDDDFSVISYSSGEQIYNRSEYDKALGIIIKGRATVSKENAGKAVIMRDMTEGCTFGVAALFGESDHYASVIAALGKETVVAYLPQALMKRLMEKDFRTAERYIEFLSDKIRYLNRKLDLYTCSSADEKLLSFLRNECKEGSVNMQKLSRQLDIGRTTLYRALDRLVEDGKIKRDGKFVVLVDD